MGWIVAHIRSYHRHDPPVIRRMPSTSRSQAVDACRRHRAPEAQELEDHRRGGARGHRRPRVPSGARQPHRAGAGGRGGAARRGPAVGRRRAGGGDRRAHRPLGAGQVRGGRAVGHRRGLVGPGQQPPRAGEIRGAEGARAGLSAGPGTVHPGPVRRRRSGASRAGAHGHHRRLAGAVLAQHLHPPAARGTGGLPARLRHPARAAFPDRSGDRRRAQRHHRSRCRSSSASSSSPAASTPAR